MSADARDAFLVQVLDALNDPNAVMGEGRPHWLAKDWVLEVLHRGDRKKDLVENVERYAHLGIPEYFVYDRENQQVLGYRLSQRGSGRYLRIVPQLGRVPSAVLGLDLAVVGGKLQLFHGMAEVFGTGQLLGRLRGMMSDLEVRASEADGRALQADGRASQAEDALREAILALLEARGIDMPESARDTLRNLPRVTGW